MVHQERSARLQMSTGASDTVCFNLKYHDNNYYSRYSTMETRSLLGVVLQISLFIVRRPCLAQWLQLLSLRLSVLVNLLALVRNPLVLLSWNLVVAVGRIHWCRVGRVARGAGAARSRALAVRVVLVEVGLRVWVHQLLANLLALLLGSSRGGLAQGGGSSRTRAGSTSRRWVLRWILGVVAHIRVGGGCGGGGGARRVSGVGVGNKRGVFGVGGGARVGGAQGCWGDAGLDHSLDVPDKQWVQQVDDTFTLSHGQGSLERNPHTFQVHRSDLDNMPNLLQLQDTVTATTRHLGHVQELGAVDHVVVGTTNHGDVVGVHLVAQGFFILPHGGGDTRTNAWRLVLANGRIGVSSQRVRRHQAFSRRWAACGGGRDRTGLRLAQLHRRSGGTGRTRRRLLGRLVGSVHLTLGMLLALLVNRILVVRSQGAQVAWVVGQVVGALGALVLLRLLLLLVLLVLLLRLLYLLHGHLAWVVVQAIGVLLVLGKQLQLRHGLALRLARLLGLVQTLGSASVHVLLGRVRLQLVVRFRILELLCGHSFGFWPRCNGSKRALCFD